MQPQNDAQAEFAMDFVFLARARRNQWSRYEASLANPQDEFNEPLPAVDLPFTPWTTPTIYDLAYVTETFFGGHANHALRSFVCRRIHMRSLMVNAGSVSEFHLTFVTVTFRLPSEPYLRQQLSDLTTTVTIRRESYSKQKHGLSTNFSSPTSLYPIPPHIFPITTTIRLAGEPLLRHP